MPSPFPPYYDYYLLHNLILHHHHRNLIFTHCHHNQHRPFRRVFATKIMPRLIFNKTNQNDKATKGKKYGTPIHKRVNTILSVILGAKGSCGSGYGPTLSHQRSVIARSRTVRENSNAGAGKGFGEKKVQLEELFAGKETMSMKSEEMMEEEKEDEEEVFELCKIRILLGKKCKTMNLSGELRYDADGVLIPEDYIS